MTGRTRSPASASTRLGGPQTRVSAALLCALLSGAAHAATRPGRAVTAGPCTDDAAAACWADAVVLERFASETGVFSPSLTADVRIGWDARGVLVRVTGLPEGLRVEVTIGTDPDQQPLRRVLGGSERAVGDSAVTAIPLAAPPTVGDVHAAWVSVVDAAAALGPEAVLALDAPPMVRPWAPAGPGDLTEPILLGLANTARQPTIEVEGTRASAPGGRLTAATVAPAQPRGRHHAAWSTTGRGTVDFSQAPAGEWISVNARWPDGRVAEVLVPGGSAQAEGIVAADIFPAPKVLIPGRGDGLHLAGTTTLSVSEPEWAGAAELLTRELRRISGVMVEPVDHDGVLRIERADPRSLPREVRASLTHPEGFALRIDAAGAVVSARSLLGATWGALALVDALGVDATAPAMVAGDRPAVDRRVLVLPLTTAAGPLDAGRIEDLVERVALRGRYNELVFDLRDGFRWTRRRALGRPSGLDTDAVRALDRAARAVGLTVAPALDLPGGARWITDARADLKEDGKMGIVCTRSPDWRAIAVDLVDEAMALLPHAPYLDIGHDQLGLATGAVWGTQRCALCAGSPRTLLFGEHASFLAERVLAAGRDLVISAEIVSVGDGGARATVAMLPSDRLTLRADASDLDRLDGFAVLESRVGYATPWQAPADRVAGRVLRLDAGQSWRLPATAGPPSAPQPEHWTRVLVAGATAWRPDLAARELGTILSTVRDAPAFLPGWPGALPLARAGPSLALEGAAPAAERGWPEPTTDRAAALEVSRSPKIASLGEPVRAAVDRPLRGASVLLGAAMDHAAWQRLSRRLYSPDTPDGLHVGALVAVLEDGTETRRPIDLGTDLAWLWGGPENAFPWNAAARWLGPSPEAAALGAAPPERALVRLDWHFPTARTPVRQLRVEVAEPGVELLVAALSPVEFTLAR